MHELARSALCADEQTMAGKPAKSMSGNARTGTRCARARRSRGPTCGDATVEPDKHVVTGLMHGFAVRSQREPSSALRRAIHRTQRDGTCSARQRAHLWGCDRVAGCKRTCFSNRVLSRTYTVASPRGPCSALRCAHLVRIRNAAWRRFSSGFRLRINGTAH